MSASMIWKGVLGFGFGLANLALFTTGTVPKSNQNASSDADLPNIAIIGAGIGGTSSAYHLRQLFGDNAKIDVYEPGHVGGRIKAVQVDGRFYEAGASIIHPKNQYMVNFTKMLGLEHRKQASGQVVGFFDGKEMIFTGSSWDVVFIGKLLWRYGLSVVKLNYWVENLLSQFKRIYDHQEAGHAFTTVEKLLNSMSPAFFELTQKSVREALTEAGMSKRFIDEVVMVALRNNYGQTPDVHAFVGSVSLSGIQPGLWAVAGGNQLVPQKLLGVSNVNANQSQVAQVKLVPGAKPKYQVMTTDGVTKVYDVVIVAAPQHQNSRIEFSGFPDPVQASSQYHRTVSNLAKGTQSKAFFGLSESDIVNEITTTNVSVFFNTFAQNFPVDYNPENDVKTGHQVWKSFSQIPLTEEQINELFKSHDQVVVADWLAYPSYASAEKMPSFVLHDQLYYLNAIERAASAMEMSAIGGRNVALLAYNRWFNKVDKIDSESVMVKIVPKKKKNEL
ncbi:prenylcysteine oxidase 1-like [Lineus longissimus]|uniref:prenylcysteine oxidase 1-like n=1 Tax=Lineus longissimus TaxID=88925 RepID=UPI002B4F293E